MVSGRGIEHGKGTFVEGSWRWDQKQYVALFLMSLQDNCLEKMLRQTVCMPVLHLPNVSYVPRCLSSSAVSEDLADISNLNKYQCKHSEGLLQDKLVRNTSLAEGSDGVCDDLHNIPALAEALTSHDVQVITEIIQMLGIVKAYMNQGETAVCHPSQNLPCEYGSDLQWFP